MKETARELDSKTESVCACACACACVCETAGFKECKRIEVYRHSNYRSRSGKLMTKGKEERRGEEGRESEGEQREG